MSVQTSKTTVHTYKTMNLPPEPVKTTVISARAESPLPRVTPVSPLPYTAVNGSYESVRYLVPVQQALPQQSFVFMGQPMMGQPMMGQTVIQQPMMQQPMMQPVYLQTLPRVSVSSQESDHHLYQQRTALEVRPPNPEPRPEPNFNLVINQIKTHFSSACSC